MAVARRAGRDGRALQGGRRQGVDMPADEVLEVVDTVIVRPDPEPQPAA